VSGSLTDADLVRIYRSTMGPLYAWVSRRVGGDQALAEDLVQDTWMRAVADWPAHGVPREPLAWLIRVARNTLVSHFRRMRPDLVDPALLDAVDPSTSLGASGSAPLEAGSPDTALVINWGLARLRRGHAELLEEFYFAEKSVREIAPDRGLSERAVEGRLRRARAKLRKVIERIRPRDAKRIAEAEGGTHRVQPRTP
jgi:RNA polymerase sigma-70 factor (ECF subfamily)